MRSRQFARSGSFTNSYEMQAIIDPRACTMLGQPSRKPSRTQIIPRSSKPVALMDYEPGVPDAAAVATGEGD